MDARIVGTRAVIDLDPQLTGGEASIAFAELVRRVVAEGVTDLILECSRVELVNSSGLGMLVSALATVRSHGGTCMLVAVPERMRALLELTHLDTIFTLRDTLAEALQQ